MTGDSVHMTGDSVHMTGEWSAQEWQSLERIASQARQSKSIPPQQMERLILDLCRGRWLTRKDLGKLLHRNADGLRSRFLTAMVDHGLLRLRHPDKPNRIDQAYRSVDDDP
ncbi:MAG: hypothetical protein HQM03_14395 [Magnetococcales bacterium]|nr:hypothetical protein [Magnetococcales bacterium]